MAEILALNKDWLPWLSLLSLGVAFNLGTKFHWSLGLLYCIIMQSGFRSGMGTETALTLTLIAFVFCNLPREWATKVAAAFYGLCTISTIITFCQLNEPAYSRMGISGNASMNGCLIAVTLPVSLQFLVSIVFPWSVIPLVFATVAIVAVFGTQTSIPVGVLAIVILAQAFAMRNLKHIGWWVVVAVFSGIGLFMNPTHFFDSSGRIQGWKVIFNWWLESGEFWNGLGTGAGNIIFANHAATHSTIGNMYWAHNDFLQILFDNGVIGLVSASIVLLYALRASFNRPWLFSAIGGYGAMAFFNFPAHLPIHALVGASLLWLAHTPKEKLYA